MTRPASNAPTTGRAGRRRPLELLYVLWSYPCPSETFIDREIAALREADVRVTLLVIGPAPDGGDDRRDTLRPGRAGWLRLALSRPGLVLRGLAAARPWRSWRTPQDLYRVVRDVVVALSCLSVLGDRRLDLLHAHFAGVPASVTAILARLLGRPWGLSVHARDVFVPDRHVGCRLSDARHVVACSAELARRVRGSPGIAADRVHVVHHGLDLATWRRNRPGRRAPATLLVVGRLEPKKGVDVLLRACAGLRRRDLGFRLRIVGDGPQRANLSEQVRALGLEDVTEWVPWSSPAELREEYQDARVLVVPGVQAPDGDRDNVPNVLIEALAMELPVIASASACLASVPGLEEAVTFCESGDEQALEQALARELAEERGDTRRTAAGRALVERHFDRSACRGALLAIYDETAGPFVPPETCS